MDKNNNKIKIEKDWYAFWEKEGFFRANPDSNKTTYSLLMPPPNVNGELHLGHAMEHSILDALARFKRVRGFDVLLLPGVDHAGILFEGTFNKLIEKQGLSKKELGREEWLKRAWEFEKENYNSFHETWKLMGISADWEREVFTMEPKVAKAVFCEFKTFWEQGLLYKGAYIIQWCPKCGTAIEDLEMEYEEKKEKLYYIKYEIVEADFIEESIVIATARPETIFADSGIAIYPNHPDFAQYEGKHAVNPLTEQSLLIFSDHRVDKEFGTGALKITPGHDFLDFEIGKDHNLPIRHAIDKNGKMAHIARFENEPEGSLAELTINNARQKVVEKLESLNAIDKVEDYTHSVPVCERCKTVVEPLISEEWFVKMKPLANKALKNLDKINFLPKNYRKILADWYKKIHDWSISRSLWWGHRIPVWYCEDCNPNHKVGKTEDMEISLEKPSMPCRTCQRKQWVQDEQVLDTWFSSGLWPMATLGWPTETKELDKYYPWDFETSAPEIKFLWIARMIMLGLWFKDKIPFKNQFFHGMLRDLQGRKFSKSLGNGISPYDLVSQWGVDATRMALYTYAIPGRDARTSRQIMDERCKNYRNFGTKLRNIYRFIYELKPESQKTEGGAAASGAPLSGRGEVATSEDIERGASRQDPVHINDKQILKKLDKTINLVTKNLEDFKLHLATEELYNFIWHEFADKYIESTKTRRAKAQPVLEYVFKTSLELLHPFMPFITEELWQKLVLSKTEGLPHHGKSIMITKWPQELSYS